MAAAECVVVAAARGGNEAKVREVLTCFDRSGALLAADDMTTSPNKRPEPQPGAFGWIKQRLCAG